MITVNTTLTDEPRQFRAPQTMTPYELGDSLARLVWESFTDFISQEDVETPLADISTLYGDDRTNGRTSEEALIFFMWAHTRGVQMAFLGRTPEARIREGLDALHGAVFEDMVRNGTQESQLPLFEQHVSARYAEYHQAADQPGNKLGQAVARHMLDGAVRDTTAAAIQERAVAVAKPLKDFLEDVELIRD
ncbi:MAG TPA: hypothetical protein DCY33_07750 [Gemmatimonadetes bacterium]|jgi:hypothetical protein|nr:hypothetical protein [Gemmatimonadota bacterium]|tara:strand:- start:418 stop:990 length:573 start_codon:yes stop_codon:yes gene_type:complete